MKIDPEFQVLIPPLDYEEKSQLGASLRREGCRDPLVTWQGILLDGHHRYAICTQYNIPFQTVEIDLPDREAVKAWMIATQLGRRNLKPEIASYLRGKRYEFEKQSHGGLRRPSSDQNEHLKTAERLAEEYEISPITIRRDAEFAQAVDTIGAKSERLKEEVLSGKISKEEAVRLSKDSARLNEAVRERLTIGEILRKKDGLEEEAKRRRQQRLVELSAAELGNKLDADFSDWKLSPLEQGERLHVEVQAKDAMVGMAHLWEKRIRDIAEFCRGFLAREERVKTLEKNL